MMRRIAAFAAVLLLVAGTARAQLLPGGADADPDKLRATEALGLRIYRHDRAAALATDALLAKRKYRKENRLGGWLTEAREDAVLVSFIDANSATPLIRYQVSVPDGEARRLKPEAFDPPKPLAPSQLQAWTARTTALKSSFELCSQRYNTVVLPSDSGEPGWSVFLLPATTVTDQVPFGGSHRLEISGDGTSITHSRKYTNTCISFSRTPPKLKDHTEDSVGITHLLDPAPTEMHVWLNLMMGLRVAVATTSNHSLWYIEKTRIRYVKKLEGLDSPPAASSTAPQATDAAASADKGSD